VTVEQRGWSLHFGEEEGGVRRYKRKSRSSSVGAGNDGARGYRVKGSLDSLRFDRNSSMNYSNWNVSIQLQAPWGTGIARETRQAAAF
jgi:hypothetical protein